MQYLVTILLCLVSVSHAQVINISEIQPLNILNQTEWFEFSVDGTEQIDFTDWVVSDGKRHKKFQEVEAALVASNSAIKTAPLSYQLIESPTYFWWAKSPISLPNDGGRIEILDPDGHIAAQAEYPKTKSGTYLSSPWSEIWNLNIEKSTYWPLWHHHKYPHSRGQKNHLLPTPSDEYEMVISEVSPDNLASDFIELLVLKGPEKINLKYLTIKHNGTIIWQFDHDFWVKPKERVIIYFDPNLYGLTKNMAPYEIKTNKKTGLSAGSGTIEIISFTKTSLEKTVDFWCWKDEKLSQTELKRVDKYRLSRLWEGPCYEVSDLIKNQSIALSNEVASAQNINHLVNHFNGSPGQENEPQNETPKAEIEVQGDKKVAGAIPFSLNLNGESSDDPDGNFDIKSYEWRLNDRVFSQKPNPSKITINEPGNHDVSLKVTDYSGASHTHTINVQTFEKNNLNPSQTTPKKDLITLHKNEDLNFLTPVIPTKYPNYPSRKISKKDLNNIYKNNPVPQHSARRNLVLPDKVRIRAHRNLGILFTWREAPWPDLAAESIFDEAVDQNFARFEAGYLGALPAPYSKPLIAVTQSSAQAETQ